MEFSSTVRVDRANGTCYDTNKCSFGVDLAETWTAMLRRLTEVVNVASVPLRSPFRYPGGKTWLVPRVRRWLRTLPERPARLVEPFAGGAIIGLTAAFEDLVDEVVLVELDDDVASVWITILNGDGDWLVEHIADLELNHDTVARIMDSASASTRDRALATIVRNRINRGGILAPGAGKMKRGENGNGLASRWYPNTLCRRIRDIMQLRQRIRFIHGDGLQVMERNVACRDTAYFIDPPYPVAGRRLYRCNEIDHRALFMLTGMVRGPFLMTYDHSDEILKLAEEQRFDIAEVAMKTTHHSHKLELFIARDLEWLPEVTLPLR